MTPHSMTGYTLAELMFNRRPYKTHLPVPQTKCLLVHWQKVKANDNTAKAKMKEQADKKAYVHQSSIKVGDKVLYLQPRRTKHTTPFNNQPYTVLKVKGSLVSASRPGHTITRHITFFKKLANTPSPIRERTQAHHALPDNDAVGIQHKQPPNVAPNPPNLAPNPLPYQQPTTPNQTGIPSMEIRQGGEGITTDQEDARRGLESVRPDRPARARVPPARYRDNHWETDLPSDVLPQS